MKKYTYSFRGRKVGAIGIFYNISHTYEAKNAKDAAKMLYKDYEHIKQLKLNGKDYKIPDIYFS